MITYFWRAKNLRTEEIVELPPGVDFVGEESAFKSATYHLRAGVREGTIDSGPYTVEVISSDPVRMFERSRTINV